MSKTFIKPGTNRVRAQITVQIYAVNATRSNLKNRIVRKKKPVGVFHHPLKTCSVKFIKKDTQGRPSRWRRSKTWRSPSSPQIHQKYIYKWNNSYRTPTEHWQKTSDFPKGKKLPT